MKKYLIDASVVVKSILQENINVEEKFKNLLIQARDKKLELISTKLLSFEVSNALRYEIKDKEECLQILKNFSDFPIKTLILTKNQIKQSIQAAYTFNTTVYDSSYHVLAKSQNALFLTCDEKYYEKAKDLGSIELIK